MENTNENPDFIKFYDDLAETPVVLFASPVSYPLPIFASPEQGTL